MQEHITQEKKRVAKDCEDKEAGNQWASTRKTNQCIGRNRFPSQRQFEQQRREKSRRDSGELVQWHNGRVDYNMPHPLSGFALGSHSDHVRMDRAHGERT